MVSVHMNRLRTRRIHPSVSVILLMLSWACLLTAFWKYPLLDTTTLLLPVDQFPTYMPETRWTPHWERSYQDFLPGEALDPSAGVAMYSWVDTNAPVDATVLNQLVYDYGSQPQAWWSYLHYSDRPTPGTVVQTVPQRALPPGIRFADQERLLCLDGDTISCTTWCYWARYQQYVIRVYLSNHAQRIDRGTIVALIERLDQHVQQRVQSGRYR